MKYTVTINGKKFEVEVEKAGEAAEENKGKDKQVLAASAQAAETYRDVAAAGTTGSEEMITAPMPGTILSPKVKEGQKVKKGQLLFILEAMKMENDIMAPRDAVVTKINVAGGTQVKTGDLLAILN